MQNNETEPTSPGPDDWKELDIAFQESAKAADRLQAIMMRFDDLVPELIGKLPVDQMGLSEKMKLAHQLLTLSAGLRSGCGEYDLHQRLYDPSADGKGATQ